MILVDVHAEATSEKIALAQWLDGRVTAVVGTHTHVQTADARVQPGGTAAITDVGMTGPHDSVIGVKTALATHRMRTGMPVRFEVAEAASGSRECSSSATPRAAGQRRSGRFESPGPDPATAPHDEGGEDGDEHEVAHAARPTRQWDRTASRAPSSRSGTTPCVSAHADDEQRDRGDPLAPWTSTTIASSQIRN